MAYVDELIAESLKAGHSIDSIVKDFSKSDDPEEKSWATNWINTASKPEYAPGAGIKKEKSLTRMLDFVEENPETAAGIAVATYAATKIPKAIAYYEDRKIKKEELAIKRLSAESYAKQVASQPLQLSEDLSHADIANMVKTERNVTGKPNPLAASFEEKFKMPLAEAEQLSGGRITNAVDAEIAGNAITKARGFSINPIPGIVSNQPPGIPGAVSPMNQLTGGATPPAPMANAVSPSLTEAVTTDGNVTKALNENLAKDIDAETTKKVTFVSPDTAIKVVGLVRDAQGNFQYPPGMSPGAIQAHKAFVQQHPEIAASLEAQGKFGMVGGGAADNSLKNTYGVDLRKQILNEVNQGQMGGINKNYLEKINPAIKALSPETGLGKTLAELKINNPKGGIKGPLGVPATIGSSGELVSSPPGKVSGLINKGSKALLLMSMVDAANAAQKGNTAPAKEVGFDLASGYALAKLLGGPAAAAAALALGSSGLNPNEQQDLDYRRRVGGGRGIAPPSAYFR